MTRDGRRVANLFVEVHTNILLVLAPSLGDRDLADSDMPHNLQRSRQSGVFAKPNPISATAPPPIQVSVPYFCIIVLNNGFVNILYRFPFE